MSIDKDNRDPVETGAQPEGPSHMPLREKWHRRALQRGELLQEIVFRGEATLCRVAHHSREPAFGLAREHGDPKVPATVQVTGVAIQHR